MLRLIFPLIFTFFLSCHAGTVLEKLAIMNGTLATQGQFPYQIQIQSSEDGSHVCGGSIINKRYILTAAHCIYSEPDVDLSQLFPDYDISTFGAIKELFGLVAPSDIQILAGVNKLDDKNGILYKVDKIIKHEHFTTDKFKNEVADIALIRLAEDIVFNDKIQPVRLASSENQEDVLSVGAPVMITGWGYTRECKKNHEEEVNDLRVAIRTISDFDECQFEYSEKRKNETDESEKPPAIDSGMICSIGFQYSCMGDSGGPIVDGRGVQVGIVSFSKDSLPDVHTSVRFYSEWITNNSKIAEN
ncbi:hypothetical protein TKK_0009310 [Trichogramma kaykai]|uniref:Peptidase S1 domain-containing protein n=1 Tax=Trichogramma kaykai TaxID=54128 RepID=A0ABD2X2C7_9HYME